MNSQLNIKVLRTSIASLPSGVRACPKATSYSYLSGLGKKGAFKIYSFYDDFGNLIKRERSYKKGKKETQEISYYKKEENKNIVKTYYYLKNKVQNFVKKVYDNKSLFEYQISADKDYENHTIARLRAGEKPKKIQYKTYWDGRAPRIKYTNTEKNFKGIKGQYYLPVIINPDSTKRIFHMHYNQITTQDIKDVVKPLQLITRKQAVKNYQNIRELEEEFIVSGFSNPNGEIFIINDIKDIFDEVIIVAHEDQHLKDFSDISRLDYNAPYAGNRFECKSVRKGIITQEMNPRRYRRLQKIHASFDPDMYQEHCLKGLHDEEEIEKCAIRRSLREGAKLRKVQNLVNKFLYE